LWKTIKEKGGGKYDFRSKRKSTNHIINNTFSASNQLKGAFEGASWNLSRPFLYYKRFFLIFNPTNQF